MSGRMVSAKAKSGLSAKRQLGGTWWWLHLRRISLTGSIGSGSASTRTQFLRIRLSALSVSANTIPGLSSSVMCLVNSTWPGKQKEERKGKRIDEKHEKKEESRARSARIYIRCLHDPSSNEPPAWSL